jgi:hypothetical protein
MRCVGRVGILKSRTSSRTSDSLTNILHLDLILSLMDALLSCGDGRYRARRRKKGEEEMKTLNTQIKNSSCRFQHCGSKES